MSNQITPKMNRATSNGVKRFLATFLFSLILIFFAADFTRANDWTFTDSLESHSPGVLDGQDGWTVTNYNGSADNTVSISAADPAPGAKYLEITNHDSMIVTHDIAPVRAGIFQLRMRHNKSGLFYFYALTSDVGGQLLFSIQFTEANGILLEEGDKQVALLPDYNANQWYLFTIDFDNSRGERGTFKVKIDDGSYGEYEYVNSESAIFDFAQIMFGSEGIGEAVSGFGDIKSSPIISALTADINDTVAPAVTTVDIDGTSIVTTNATPTAGTETTNTNIDSLTNSNDSSVAIDAESQAATVIMYDTNAGSITSPLSETEPEEAAVNTVPEKESGTTLLSADPNDEEVITPEF